MSNHDPAALIEQGPHALALNQLAHRDRRRGNKHIAELLEQNAKMGELHAAGHLMMLKAVGRVARRYRAEGKWLG